MNYLEQNERHLGCLPYLAHHGIKGQKWGVITKRYIPVSNPWKRKKRSNLKRTKNIEIQRKKRNNTYKKDKYRTISNVGKAAAISIVAAFAAKKLVDYGSDAYLQKRGQMAVDAFMKGFHNEREYAYRRSLVKQGPEGIEKLLKLDDYMKNGRQVIRDEFSAIKARTSGRNKVRYAYRFFSGKY